MIRLSTVLALLCCIPACGIPRDPEGTLERIRAERELRIGFIASDATRVGAAREKAFVARVAAATGARPVMTSGASEPLLAGLENGRLDLVIGELAPDSPWISRVAILPAIGEEGVDDGRVLLRPIARNGENAWISLLEREARPFAASIEQP
jgi:ABC-type amino acid transport substrate-binding protein